MARSGRSGCKVRGKRRRIQMRFLLQLLVLKMLLLLLLVWRRWRQMLVKLTLM